VNPAALGLHHLKIQAVPGTECHGVVAGFKPHLELIPGIALPDPTHKAVIPGLRTGLEFDQPVFSLPPAGLHGILTGLIDADCGHGLILIEFLDSELAVRRHCRQVANMRPEC
jgi:hypothetical protein